MITPGVFKKLGLELLLAFLISQTLSCNVRTPEPRPTLSPTVSKTPTATSTSTVTVTPSSTITWSPSPTFTLTYTPSPTISNTPKPTLTPQPTNTPRPTNTPTLTPTVLPILGAGWQAAEVRSVCLSIDQEYPEFVSKGDEPIADEMVRLLDLLGILVVDDAERCDAALTISLTGYAVQDTYSFPGENKKCYSGSRYQGEMRLIGTQMADAIVNISSYYNTPKIISTCYEMPYKNVDWRISWTQALIDGVGQLWSKDGLLLLLAHPSLGAQFICVTADSLYKHRDDLISNDVPVLVTTLQTCPKEITDLFGGMGVQAWDAIPALLAGWKEQGWDSVTYGTMMDYGTVIFQDALRMITWTLDPRPNCSTLTCWKTWWRDGRPPP
jgi:hypothetical protein